MVKTVSAVKYFRNSLVPRRAPRGMRIYAQVFHFLLEDALLSWAPMQLQSAVLFVKDLERMADFYGKTLGLRIIDETRMNSWIQFHAGNTVLSLHAIPSAIASGIEISSPPTAREANPIKLVFAVENVDTERARLEAAGVPILMRPWGNCDAVDPEGNVFQIVEK